MQIVLPLEGLPQRIASFLVIILFLGLLRSKVLSCARVLRQNIVLLPMVLLRYLGCSLFLVINIFNYPLLQQSTMITSIVYTQLTIMFIMLALNTLRLTFTLFVRRLLLVFYRFSTCQVRIKKCRFTDEVSSLCSIFILA